MKATAVLSRRTLVVACNLKMFFRKEELKNDYIKFSIIYMCIIE